MGRGINDTVESLYENTGGRKIDMSQNYLGKVKKQMPTIGSWYRRICRKAEENTNPDYRFHYSYLVKVMKQYVREQHGQMAYFDGQSTFELLEGVPFINLDISQLEERFARPLAQQSEIEYLKEVFKLSEGEAGFLITCNRGEGLLRVGGDSAILAIQPTSKELEFVETNLSKQIAMEKARQGQQ